MKKNIIFTLILSMMLSICAYAEVGVMVHDPGVLPEEFQMEPHPETLNTTRYAPWFLMYHMHSEAEKAMGRRGGEGGQIVMAIAASPLNPDLILIGNDTSGLWRSEDGGQNWYSINNNINMWSVPDIIFDPVNEDVVYIIQTVYGHSDSTKSKTDKTTLDGIYKSTDGGKSWVQILEKRVAATTDAHHLLAFDDFGALYALTSEGVMKTADGGKTWGNLGNVGKRNVYDLSVSPDGKTIIAACEDTGINVSFDGGATWTQRNADLVPSARSIAVIPNNENKVHWMSVYAGESTGLYESFDQGETWAPVEYVTNRNGVAAPRIIELSQPKDGNTPIIYLVYSSMGYPFRYSNDLGKTWHEPTVHNQDIFGKGITGYYAEGICASPTDPNTVYYSFGDIIYKSTDGGANFHYISSGFSGNFVNSFTFDAQGKIYFGFTDKGLGVTNAPYTSDEYPTARMVEGTGRYAGATTVNAVSINPKDHNHIMIGLGKWEEQILKQTWDGGTTWEEIAGTGTKRGAYDTIVFHREDSNVIYTDFFTTYDGGKTWVENDIAIWAVSEVNPDIVWGKKGKIVCRSSDRGKTWVELRETSDAKVIIADLFDENVAWVGCYNGSIVKFDGNNATTFHEAEGLIRFDGDFILMQALAQNPRNPLHLVAGGRATVAGTKSPGLFETIDGGQTWRVVPGLPSVRTVEYAKFSKHTSEVFLGTYYGTIIYEYNNFNKDIQLDKKPVNPIGTVEDTRSSENEEIRVLLNGFKINFDVHPTITNGRTFVPMRKIFEELESEITWDETTSTVTAQKNDTTIVLQIGNSVATVNENSVQLEDAPYVSDGRTLVPVRFIAQSLGAKVGWNEQAKIVTIDIDFEDATPAQNNAEDKNSDIQEDGVIIKKISEVGVVDINTPDENVYQRGSGSWSDNIGTATIGGKQHDKRMYYKVDLKDVIGKEIQSAKLVVKERGMKYGAVLNVYKITEDWDKDTITYKNAPNYSKDSDSIARKFCEGYESEGTIKKLDITDYVKTLNQSNSIVNIMLEAISEERWDSSHIHGINSENPPYIEVIIK